MPVREIQNKIFIARSPEQVYAYVTQPWRWHEWHPSSQGAKASSKIMRQGESFDEVIRLQPLSPLPIAVRRQTHYHVDIAEPGECWQASGVTSGGGLTINYVFTATSVEGKSGTLFQRRLTYQVKGLMRVLDPLLYERMQDLSLVALHNLKKTLEKMDA